MTVFKHEMKRGKLSLVIWTAIIAFMLSVCVLIYPEMSKQMHEISDMFADMGSFSSAFGLDQLNFGEFTGYFAIECGNVLGMGGAFFAALLGVSALYKEEKDGTAEFLLTHPISRNKIVTEKLLSVFAQIAVMNATTAAVTSLSILAVGIKADAGIISLLFIAYFFMQIEIAAITFALSAFIRRAGLGIGLGLAAVFYFLNIMAGLTEDAEFLRYLTPFGYTSGAEIVADKMIDPVMLVIGIAVSIISVVIAYTKYSRKDIAG